MEAKNLKEKISRVSDEITPTLLLDLEMDYHKGLCNFHIEKSRVTAEVVSLNTSTMRVGVTISEDIGRHINSTISMSKVCSDESTLNEVIKDLLEALLL